MDGSEGFDLQLKIGNRKLKMDLLPCHFHHHVKQYLRASPQLFYPDPFVVPMFTTALFFRRHVGTEAVRVHP